jgi:preprotein translocase subunit SecA
MFQKVLRLFGSDPTKREISKIAPVIDRINQLESAYEALSDEALAAKTNEFRQRLANGETLDDLLPDGFAAVREASKRTLGMRHYDVQLMGGYILNQGRIAEMRTGEGKTLVATLPIYLNALSGRGVHLVTVNDYLARRDARWMAPIYHSLGMSVGVLQMAARTDNGTKAFLVDLEKVSPSEDQNQLRLVNRREAYQADITYGTNSEFGFDYLRDNLTFQLEERVQRGHNFAIVDEVDNVLIDEARTPLIISGPASEETEWYVRMAGIVRQFRPEDYEINEKDRTVTLTELGDAHAEELLGTPLRDPERPEDINPEQARMLGYLEQAMRAQFLYKRNKDYLVQGGKVIIVDEFTGRLMPGRRWSEGLHQSVEAKENVRIEPENVTYATITLQNYFRMYEKLAGMTGTALTEAEEFGKIYKLEVQPVPTNLEYIALQQNSPLVAIEAKDEQGYKYAYYAEKSHPDVPVYFKRKDYTDVVFRSEEAKLRAITQEIIRFYVLGRPQLVGTTSVEHSERLSMRLSADHTRRLLQILLLRRTWMEKNHIDYIERPIPELQAFLGPITEINPGDLRPFGRSLDLNNLNLEEPDNLRRLLKELDLSSEDEPRLISVFRGGVPHQVLNARKHDEESQIILRAGEFGSVTIATNMAGRGVDIKLGGQLPEEVLRDTNRVLMRGSDADPFNLTQEERYEQLVKVPKEEYGIYEESIDSFFTYVKNMERVRMLGGLHVIGSERHEARRIDNQLRGRAARQGDPGSSRFYLSLEDDLMRLFGGQQVENIWKRIAVDESMPIEMGILGRLVEQSQERVEGSNFDIRKHLLEYDDVLNSQRKRIYEQRDRAFMKSDLSEDILEMLSVELQKRIPKAFKDEEGPWKLLAYLEDVQPLIDYEAAFYPSFTYRIIIDALREKLPKDQVEIAKLRSELLTFAETALRAEQEHVLHSTRQLLDHTDENLENQLSERKEIFDNFIEGLGEQEEGVPERKPADLLAELSELVRTPLKLSTEQLRVLPEGDEDVVEELRRQVEDTVYENVVKRVAGAIENRLEESLGIQVKDLVHLSWKDISNELLDAMETTFDKQIERLCGDQGQIAHDLDPVLNRYPDLVLNDRTFTGLLSVLSQGSRLSFDTRTHRRAQQRYLRLRFIYLAASYLQNETAESVTEKVHTHLQDGLVILQQARGYSEWNRMVMAQATLKMLDSRLQEKISEELGTERFEALQDQPIASISGDDRRTIQEVLGDRLQNEAYRQLLLRVISDRWVDYLTQVEALRISIGLEAYAQRDPLVQYKSRASELFQALLGDVRIGVIGGLFTFQPSRRAVAALSTDREHGEEEEVPAAIGEGQVENQPNPNKKKRRRH